MSWIHWQNHLPQGWDVLRLKWIVVSVDSGVSVNATDEPAGADEVGVLKTSAVSGGTFFPEENKTVWPSEMDRLACPVRSGTVIMSRMNTPSLVAESGYCDRDYPNLFLPDRLWQITFDTDRVYPPYVGHVLASADARTTLAQLATGTSGSMKNLAKEDMLNLLVPLPPLAEQISIAGHIEAETVKLDALRAAAEHAVTLLRERRAALIAASVTGKVRVG